MSVFPIELWIGYTLKMICKMTSFIQMLCIVFSMRILSTSISL